MKSRSIAPVGAAFDCAAEAAAAVVAAEAAVCAEAIEPGLSGAEPIDADPSGAEAMGAKPGEARLVGAGVVEAWTLEVELIGAQPVGAEAGGAAPVDDASPTELGGGIVAAADGRLSLGVKVSAAKSEAAVVGPEEVAPPKALPDNEDDDVSAKSGDAVCSNERVGDVAGVVAQEDAGEVDAAGVSPINSNPLDAAAGS